MRILWSTRFGQMRTPDFLRTATFRLAAMFAGTFSLSAALLFAFIYWQTSVFETGRVDAFMTSDAKLIAATPLDAIEQTVSMRILGDLHRITFAAVFDPAGQRLAGNLEEIPAELKTDGHAYRVDAVRLDDGVTSNETMRAVARRLDNGDLLIIGRNIDELEKLRQLVERALMLGVIPAMVLSLLAGGFISRRAQERVRAVRRSAARIMAGDLRERLPARGSPDDFDRLAGSVNHMLDEIARLLDNVKSASDGIAHDLRTPLARVRARLERGQQAAQTKAELLDTVGSAIRDLDQALELVTTVLRIGAIDSSRRQEAFTTIDLSALIDEAAEIYRPLAEEKSLGFEIRIESGLTIHGNRGLIMEALAHLIQNAVKFTPDGGCIIVAARRVGERSRIDITDNGPGILEEARERVFDRFYRLDKSRHIDGNGLGLSLVASIVKLHDYQLTLSDAAPGCNFTLICH